MNLADIIILTIVFGSGLLGLLWGLVREMLGLGAWALAILAGVAFSQYFQAPMERFLRGADLIDVASFLIPFLITLVFLSVLAGIVGRLVRRSLLSGVDRLLGFFFGLVRGAALIVVAYILLGKLMPQNNWPTMLLQARTMPLVDEGALWAVAQIPPQYRPYLSAATPGEAENDPGTGETPAPSVPFGHPFGAAPHSHVPTYEPGPGQ